MPCDWNIHFCSILRNTGGYQCSILFKFCKSTEDSAIEGGGECNTPVLNPLALKIHDTHIVNNLGVELKAKAPPSIWLCYVSVIRIVIDGILGHMAHMNLWHHVTMHFN